MRKLTLTHVNTDTTAPETGCGYKQIRRFKEETNKQFDTPIVLTQSLCDFRQCTFHDGKANTNFISANDGSIRCSFISCLFTKIDATTSHQIIRILSATDEIINRCCFYQDTSNYVYGTGNDECYCIPSVSVNSTVCSTCTAHSPYWGGINSYTNLFNNSTHLELDGWTSCCYLMRNIPNRDDINCFFSGTSCVGLYPVQLTSDVQGCIMSKYNFVNNTDTSGYFYFYHPCTSILKDSVISFTPYSTQPRWICRSGGSLLIENTYVIAPGEFAQESGITTQNVKKVTFASTHKPFAKHPYHSECGV